MDGVIRVRLGASSGCAACDAGRGCGAGVFGRLLRRKPVTLEFPDTLGAGPGQAVIVGLPESMFLSLAARFYLYPLLGALAGGVLAQALFPAMGDATWRDMAVLAGGAAGAVVAWRLGARRPIEFSGRNKVHLLRIKECEVSEP